MKTLGQHLDHRRKAHTLQLRLLAIVGGDGRNERAGHVERSDFICLERIAAGCRQLFVDKRGVVGAQRLAREIAIGRDRLVDVVAHTSIDHARRCTGAVQQDLNLGDFLGSTAMGDIRNIVDVRHCIGRLIFNDHAVLRCVRAGDSSNRGITRWIAERCALDTARLEAVLTLIGRFIDRLVAEASAIAIVAAIIRLDAIVVIFGEAVAIGIAVTLQLLAALLTAKTCDILGIVEIIAVLATIFTARTLFTETADRAARFTNLDDLAGIDVDQNLATVAVIIDLDVASLRARFRRQPDHRRNRQRENSADHSCSSRAFRKFK